MNARQVLHEIGRLVVVVSLTMLLPALVALGLGETQAMNSFLVAIAVGVGFGAAMVFLGRGAQGGMHRQEGLAVVGLAWVFCAAIGCIPYLMSGTIDNVVDAYFETMSGFTTTGASVMPVVEENADGTAVDRSILFWRCMTNWLGGIGIVVLFVALLPALGVGGRILFQFEVPGVGDKSFLPQIRRTATSLWKIYVALTFGEIIVLWALGLDLLDAVSYSFATLATGGFAPYTASAGHYDSTAIHVVITIFMLLAGVNFTLYFKVLSRRWRDALRDTELRVYAAIVLSAIGIITIDLLARGGRDDVGGALADSSFQVASIATTTGFATADFNTWPALSRLILVILMFVGGSAGSTAGGLKVVRIAVVAKMMMRAIIRHVRPRSVERLRFGGGPLEDGVGQAIVGTVLIFLALWVIGGIALSAMGLDLTTSMTASVACLGNIGPGLGSVGPAGNYAEIPVAGKMLLSLWMLVGRLELLTVLSLFVPSLWRD